MSNIFDALLKSEGERTANNGAPGSNALEILMRAERQANAQRNAEKTAQILAGSHPVFEDTAAAQQAGPPARDVVGISPAVAMMPNGPRVAYAAVADRSESAVHAAPAILEAEVPHDPLKRFRGINISLPAFSRLVSVTDKNCPAAEAFRLLCVRLRHLRRDRALKKLLITSSIPQEGKSFTAANLACTMAAVTNQKILLLDGDLRRPAQSPIFGLDNIPGLSEWLKEQQNLESSIYYLHGPNIWFMPAGKSCANPLELLQSTRISALVDQLSGWFDWIIIDSPPMLPLADTSVLARLADGILLVTRRGRTEKRQLTRGVAAIEKSKLLGAIINSSLRYHNSDYYYYSSPPSTGEGTA